ncbi:hypothetical protein [Halovivax limisalsi]|uniref:hypothetical protein n=1 Tax=Halovivax limisalsi TaxID=1453760 RepID=UPI001FFCECBD|nr:hypothetical protein [Halovivax limisalsi]
MSLARLERSLELRRLLPIVAAVLFVLALRMPMWRITLSAPQYVDQLVVELYAHPAIGGDWEEVRALNKYVGFYYPDPVHADPNYAVHEKAVAVPEWVLGPVVFLGLAGASVLVAALPTDALSRGLTALFAAAVAIFAAMGAIIQYRLHQAGHSLDLDAPLNGVDGFTPPLLGTYEVANISGTAWFGPGGYMAVAAVALLGIAVALRNSPATITDAPALLRGGWGRLGERIGDGPGDDGDTDAPLKPEDDGGTDTLREPAGNPPVDHGGERP